MPDSNKPELCIMGYGFVGRATELLLKQNGHTHIAIHDPDQGHVIEDWHNFDYAFLCVPTPSDAGALDLTVLHSVYDMVCAQGLTPVIRSTIGPDQVDQFPDAVMMPEFIRERHWQHDAQNTTQVILGGAVPDTLINLFGNQVVYCADAGTAMLFKMARNATLATKVLLANEFSALCDQLHTDYQQLQRLFELDGCLGTTHWQVPGPDGKLGYGGSCLPKDTEHLSGLMPHSLLNTVVAANTQLRDSDDQTN